MHLILINWLLVLLLVFTPPPSRSEELLELACITDAQCSQFERGHCVAMECICTARDSDERVACRPHEEKLTNIIGGPCPCPQPDAECIKDQCACLKDYVPSADRRRCLPEAVRNGGKCEFSRQCQLTDKFSTCFEGRCVCRSNFELHEGRCLAVLRKFASKKYIVPMSYHLVTAFPQNQAVGRTPIVAPAALRYAWPRWRSAPAQRITSTTET